MLLHTRKDQYNPFGIIIIAQSNPPLDQVLLCYWFKPTYLGLKREK
jgi:hypothetical protein